MKTLPHYLKSYRQKQIELIIPGYNRFLDALESPWYVIYETYMKLPYRLSQGGTMVKQDWCSVCRKRTFVSIDDGDLYKNGKFYCSDCASRLIDCGVCGVEFIGKSRLQKVCQSCALIVNNKYATSWHIVRYHTLLRDRFTCRYCGASPLKDYKIKLECDHIIPRAKGGSDSITNLITACEACNSGKSWAEPKRDVADLIRERKVYDTAAEINATKAEIRKQMEDRKGASGILENCAVVGERNDISQGI